MIKIKLKEFLETHGYNMNSFAEHAEMRYATIYNICHQTSISINYGHLNKIMKALNITDINLIIEYVED
ncbi:helix-turn-helix domain-containing protein [Aquibacillus saliphilus]|uniref:helix-turn-helix domain-containing protein n=1 Tax=Aquibacillus saliphilus TaxID=1909422 RepID=UPI001CF0A9BF|nr:helix-turn-helix transcriptional regulator [Aquibacillus saliphilus]